MQLSHYKSHEYSPFVPNGSSLRRKTITLLGYIYSQNIRSSLQNRILKQQMLASETNSKYTIVYLLGNNLCLENGLENGGKRERKQGRSPHARVREDQVSSKLVCSLGKIHKWASSQFYFQGV